MENNETENEVKKKHPMRLLIILCAVVVVLLGAYLAVCTFAVFSSQIWPGTYVLGMDLGSMTEQEAARKLEEELPRAEISLYLYDAAGKPDRGDTPDASVPFSELGVRVDAKKMAQAAYHFGRSSGYFSAGLHFLEQMAGYRGYSFLSGSAVSADPEEVQQAAGNIAGQLSSAAVDTSFRLGKDAVYITTAADGRRVNRFKLASLLNDCSWSVDLTLDCPYAVVTAKTHTAQEIYDEISGKMKNAGYDAETASITLEKTGVEFDVTKADALLKDAAPGTEVEIPATVEYPTVTADHLKDVLFRDVLGSYTTHVGGSAARINNVKLASATLDGTVLNSGDIFSYNDVVGQRTTARGYQPAPAYVGGDTVDEIGGGVCQPSSTLYLATLLANLQIVTRAAHRYVPAYMPKGMDATVSWGGPEYRFANDTNYPVKIVAVFKKGYLTMTLYGTKIDDTVVKMTNKVLSTTPSKVIYQEDSSLAPGTQQVKQTAYTGYKVETYRNLYDGEGNLLSSKLEAVTNYKVRDKIILVGPKAVETDAPTEGTADGTPTDTAPGTSPETPDGTATTPAAETPAAGTPTGTETPAVPTGIAPAA